MPLFDEDFDFNYDFGYGDTPSFDVPSFSLSDIDLGSLIGDIPRFEIPDLSTLENFGFDLSDLGIGSLDIGDMADAFNFGDLSNITGGIEGFGDVSDIIGQGAAGIPGIEGFGDIADIVGQGSNLGIDPYAIDQLTSRDEFTFGQGKEDPFAVDQQTSRNEFTFGQGVQDPYAVDQLTSRNEFNFGQGLEDPFAVDQQTSRNEYTFGQGLQDPYEVDQQTTRNEFTFGQGLQDPYEVDQQTTRDELTFGQGVQDPYEVDGLQGSRTEETALKGTTPGGSEVIKTPPKTEPPKTPTTTTGTKTVSDIFKDLLGGKDPALLMALLGGLLGLLGRKSAPQAPVGYQGGIPAYTATRVPGRGVQYTRAASGGLMDLAGGGQPARYLRGGTDGMADKIKTDIDGKQPARLSHGEFVIPADVVSHLGNGNSDAGADVLYDMMAKVRKARTGTPKQGKQINPQKMIPA